MILNMEKIKVVKEEAVSLLRENISNWEELYKDYANLIISNLEKFKTRKASFNQWAPLYLYSTIGDVKKNKNEFQLRYQGQTVAAIKVTKEQVLLSTNGYDQSNSTYFSYDKNLENIDWRSTEGTEFRKHFSCLDESYRPRQLEHKLESMILTEMEKGQKETKFQGTFHGIQPVKIADIVRFQMKTPLKASEKNKLKFSEPGNGGGIDILARFGRGIPALSVFELKRTGITDLQSTLEQGLAYTIFLRELLRSKSGSEWYKIFGYTGELPQKLRLNCVVLMENDTQKPNFEDHLIPIDQDIIQLHYMFYKENNDGIIIIEESLRSSL